jgi:hypothetical protein
MELADLAAWTPVAIDLTGPAPMVDWADLRGRRFAEPFFDQTVGHWAASGAAAPLVRTGLEALSALDAAPSLAPSGMIFHLSRCGSTLVSRLLGTMPGVVVIAEPGPLNTLLELDPDRVDPRVLVNVVRLLVRALGRIRLGDETKVILKLSSWNIRRRAILAAAFPETQWVWVQRSPQRVLASLLSEPPGWLGLQAAPARAARLFGLDAAEIPAMSRLDFAARSLGAMVEAAAADPVGRLVLDYADLPAAIWVRVAGHFGLSPGVSAIGRMAEEARFYAKDPGQRVFAGNLPTERRLTPEMQDAALAFVEPAYRTLGALGPGLGRV